MASGSRSSRGSSPPGGDWVVVAGMVSQRNYFDANAYAHSAHSQFLNSALVHSQVLPLAQYNLGLNLQWQPHKDWYVMAGASSGRPRRDRRPGPHSSQERGRCSGSWVTRRSTPSDWGPAFTASNLSWRGRKAPPGGWHWIFNSNWARRSRGRGSAASDSAEARSPRAPPAQAGTGFVIQGPLELMGLFPSRKYDSAGLSDSSGASLRRGRRPSITKTNSEWRRATSSN